MDGNASSTSRIGFIGVGIMGGPMAQRLLAQGRELTVYDIDSKATERLRLMGATVSSSPREVADQAEAVFACLPSPTICRDVALGPDGISHGKLIRYYIETSTMGGKTSEAIAAELGKHEIGMLDAPISGGPAGAHVGTLTTIVAGPKDLVDSCLPLIQSYAENIFHVSERQGGAQLTKLINNSIAIFGMLLTFEGLVVADEAGLDIRKLISVLNACSGATNTSQVTIPYCMLADDPKPAGRIANMLKDVRLYMDEAQSLGLNLPVAHLLARVSEDAGADPNQDAPEAIYQYLTRMAHETPGIATSA